MGGIVGPDEVSGERDCFGEEGAATHIQHVFPEYGCHDL